MLLLFHKIQASTHDLGSLYTFIVYYSTFTLFHVDPSHLHLWGNEFNHRFVSLYAFMYQHV